MAGDDTVFQGNKQECERVRLEELCFALQLRTQAEFEAANGVKAPAGKRYFQHTRLHDIIGLYPFRSGLADAQLAEEKNAREAFLDFLLGVLVGCQLSYISVKSAVYKSCAHLQSQRALFQCSQSP
jgi:hypothetical protein